MDEFTEITNCLECAYSEDCFKQLIPSEREFINRNKTQIIYSKGEIICKEKAYASHILYIADGLVKLYLESPNSRRINISIMKASEFIGLSSVYGEDIYQYSSIAMVDTTICMITKDTFRRILSENGVFASDVIQWYCIKEKHLFKRIKSLVHKQMHGRLAEALLYLCDENFNQDIIFNHLSRRDIADFAAISTESTVRLLTELKGEGIIDLIGKKIVVTDKKRLSEISRYG